MADLSSTLKGNKATWTIAIVAGGGIFVYMWIKKHNAAQTATATAANSYGYNAGSYGMYGYGMQPIYGYGMGGLGNFVPTTTGYGSYGYNPNPVPTTNSQWFQQAIAWLSQGGTSITTAEAALAKYLAGQPVTAQQALIVQEAEGAVGPPPQAGPNGYPPNINTSGGGGGGNAQNPVSGLHQTQVGTTGGDISWTASSGATSYKVTSTKGTVSMTGPTSARVHDISNGKDRGDQATVSVLAEPAAANARAATVIVHTHR